MAPSIYSIRLDDVIIDCPEQGRKQFILFFIVFWVWCVCALLSGIMSSYTWAGLGRIRQRGPLECMGESKRKRGETMQSARKRHHILLIHSHSHTTGGSCHERSFRILLKGQTELGLDPVTFHHWWNRLTNWESKRTLIFWISELRELSDKMRYQLRHIGGARVGSGWHESLYRPSLWRI